MPSTNPASDHGLLTYNQSVALIGDDLPGMQDDCQAALEYVDADLDGEPERRATYEPSTIAAMVFNRFVVLAERRFLSRATRRGRMLTISFGGRLLVRFKKLNRHLLTGNVDTKSQRQIRYQGLLEAVVGPTVAVFGYRLDASGRRLEGIYLTCPKRYDANHWAERLDDNGRGGLLGTVPSSPVTPQGDAPQFVVRARGTKLAKAE